jgi:FKBP12-rapamycin complex-associated protein
MEQGPTTARETSFAQTFGRDLHEAREACRRYRAFGEMSELNKAWDIYYGVSLGRVDQLCLLIFRVLSGL